jgi:CubicO group peptidase (beta-lactamase class C family)
MLLIHRRTFITGSFAALGLRRWPLNDDLDAFINAEMARDTIPGLAAVIIKSGQIAWSRGYGFADIGAGRRMDPAATIQNIGSISKTFTGTAVMQLVERNLIDLDQDVSRYLQFEVRHPAHPAIPLTCRLLMTHRSGIIDGDAYGAGYACGDPATALGDWLREYLTPTGRSFKATDSFGDWQPGTMQHPTSASDSAISSNESGDVPDYTQAHLRAARSQVSLVLVGHRPRDHASTSSDQSQDREEP